MAAVKVLINGVAYFSKTAEAQPVTIVGDASLFNLSIGGGPVEPPEQPPLTPPPHPAFPIWGGPGAGFPDKPGYPPVVGGGPIIPPPPDGFPNPPEDGMAKPPPPEGGWGYHPDYGWGYFPGSGGLQPHTE